MCGLAGWYALGTGRPTKDQITWLLMANQRRGLDATGAAWWHTGKVWYKKAAGKAEDYLAKEISDTQWVGMLCSPVGLLHTRARTKGDPRDNKNNHPVIHQGWVVTHNGQITNDDRLFAAYDTPRFADVDSAAIPLVLSKATAGASYLDQLRQLSLLDGRVAAVAWSVGDPERLAFVRLPMSNALLFTYDADNKILYWSSDPVGLEVIPMVSVGNIGFVANQFSLAEKHVLVFDRRDTKPVRAYELDCKPYRLGQFSTSAAFYTGGVGRYEYGSVPVVGERVPIKTRDDIYNNVRSVGGVRYAGAVARGDVLTPSEAARQLPKHGHVAPAITSAANPQRYGYRYVNQNLDVPELPVPDFGQLNEDPTPHMFSLSFYYRKFHEEKSLLNYVRTTTLGRWHITREWRPTTSTHVVVRKFQPHKRVRQYWRDVVAGDNQLVNIPSTADHPLDNVLKMDKVDFFAHTFSHETGLLCRVCGVWYASTTTEKGWRSTCIWCGIASRIPLIPDGTKGVTDAG